VKTAKQIVIIGAILVLLLGAVGCSNGDEAETSTPQRRQVETVKPNEDDGQIYRAVETFVNALVNDDRSTVLDLLTTDHRNSWRDDSFLLNAEAKNRYDEFDVDNLNYTIVKYVNNEDTNFVETAFIIAVYDVLMKSGSQEDNRVKMQESLAFRREGEAWKISVNDRGFLVPQN
jgi:ketosteroid isomerase-like protein